MHRGSSMHRGSWNWCHSRGSWCEGTKEGCNLISDVEIENGGCNWSVLLVLGIEATLKNGGE
jgi:hypothetical protein